MEKAKLVFALLVLAAITAGCVPAPEADYGDAPNGTATGYPSGFAQKGFFPTFFSADGARALDIDVARLGPGASLETDANDPNDPDGGPNLNPSDTDFDDGLVDIVIPILSIPPPATLSVNVTAPPGSPGGKFYLNVLIDLNMNGSWGGVANNGEPEWVVKNYAVDVPPGPSSQIVTPPKFAFANGNWLPDGAWMRVALTKEQVTVDDWHGTGEFSEGEIEDHVIELPDFPPKTTAPPTIPPPPTELCSKGPALVGPAGFICKDDCAKDEVCNKAKCVCEKKKKEIKCSAGPTKLGAGEVCKDDCPKDETCDKKDCVCKKKPVQKKVTCSGNTDLVVTTGRNTFNKSADLCSPDCPDGTKCDINSCMCVGEEVKVVSCYANHQEVDRTDINNFDAKTQACSPDCPEGYRCATSSCTCVRETQPKVSCWENLVEVNKTDVNNYNSNTMACAADCPEGYTCAAESCTCVRDTSTTTTTLESACKSKGQYDTEQDCKKVCNGFGEFCSQDVFPELGCWVCVVSASTTSTTTTLPLACEDKGDYSTQSDCENSCLPPDECQINEATSCWECVNYICQPPLTEDQNCNNQCGTGEVCQEYQSSGCYECQCEKDLDVTALSSSVALHSSTECVNNECTTTCSLDATSNVMVINRGQGNVGASTVSVDITPGVGINSASVPALGPGQTSQTITITHSKSAVVSGKAEACATLNWWTSTYTVTAKADSANAITECDEDNTLSGQTTASQ